MRVIQINSYLCTQNLLPIINADGEKLDIDEELDFSDRKEDGVIFLSPVEVCGMVVNIGGTLELTAEVSARLGFKCDRCCEDFTYDMSFEMSELLKKEAVGESAENENPDIIFFTGTYNSGCPVSHVGIYVGNGMMIHCGNPISYASVNSNYWTQHFYAYGRLS